MSSITIRRAQQNDLDDIVAHNRAMALETENKELDSQDSLRGARAVLQDPRKGFYLLAEKKGQVIGQLQVTFEWSDWRSADFWWIQSVFVTQKHRRRGVYTALHQHLAALAKDTPGVCGLRLYTSKNNLSAQATYMALGMQPSRYDLYEDDFVMGERPIK